WATEGPFRVGSHSRSISPARRQCAVIELGILMLVDGERLRQLIESAKSEVLLCAPFIKKEVLKKLFGVLGENTSVKVITRWRAAELAAGVSDLEVLEVCHNRPRAQFLLLDNLHAKLYLADDLGLIGSANLTAAALGWVDRSNVELLVPARRSDPEVSYLL